MKSESRCYYCCRSLFLVTSYGTTKEIVSKDMVSLTEKCMVLENFAKVRQISERR